MTNFSTDWKVHEHLHVEQSEKIKNTRRRSKELELRHSGHNGHHNHPMTVFWTGSIVTLSTTPLNELFHHKHSEHEKIETVPLPSGPTE